jgi:methylthioribose-1-phosphate isomerase
VDFDFIEKKLNDARPTAVNLMWATDRMKKCAINIFSKSDDKLNNVKKLLEEAVKIQEEDTATNKKMAAIGNEIIKENSVILTHCNTGALATTGYGTALGVVREAFYNNKNIFVYADETRPRLQGGRLTAWELLEEGIPSKLIPDSVAATLIRDGKIDVVLVGADRIASNGDTANKIGTFMLSVMCKVYNVPFYIVAPSTTIDFDILDGSQIEIEERDSKEITHIMDKMVAPEGVEVFNPAFDVTPNENITGIITEFEILKPPFKKSIDDLKRKMAE